MSLPGLPDTQAKTHTSAAAKNRDGADLLKARNAGKDRAARITPDRDTFAETARKAAARRNTAWSNQHPDSTFGGNAARNGAADAKRTTS